MKKLNYSLFASVFFFTQVWAQDPIFLNTNQSLIHLNPSFAGSNGGIRNQFSYLNQWPGYKYNPVTFVNSFDAYIRPLKAGIAFSYMSDNIRGLLSSSTYNFSYAQHLSFLEKRLKITPSVQFGYGNKKIEEGWGFPHTNRSYFDLSSGLLLNIKSNLNVGAYVFHINQPDIGLDEAGTLNPSYLFHTSYNFHFSERTQLQLFYAYRGQAAYRTSQVSANLVLFKYLVTGLSFLSGDRVQSTAGLRTNYFSLLAGYEYIYSKLAGSTRGAWELHAAFFLRDKEHRKTLTSFETW